MSVNSNVNADISTCIFGEGRGHQVWYEGAKFQDSTSELKIDDCDFQSCNTGKDEGQKCGAIRVSEISVKITNCYFWKNICYRAYGLPDNYGGAVSATNSSMVEIYNCEFIYNQSKRGGAIGAFNASAIRLVSSTFRENSVKQFTKTPRGGAVYMDFVGHPGYYPFFEAIDCNFTYNRAVMGGAIFLVQLIRSSIVRCLFQENVARDAPPNEGGLPAGFGGAIYSRGSYENPYSVPYIVFENSTFLNNEATEGAALYACGDIKNSQFLFNRANVGGAVHCMSDYLSITNSAFINNTADSEGGALFAAVAKLSIVGCEFWKNYAYYFGGALSVPNPNLRLGQTSASIENSLFAENSAFVTASALYTNIDRIEIYNSEFHRNTISNITFPSQLYFGYLESNTTSIGQNNFTCSLEYNFAVCGSVDARLTNDSMVINMAKSNCSISHKYQNLTECNLAVISPLPQITPTPASPSPSPSATPPTPSPSPSLSPSLSPSAVPSSDEKGSNHLVVAIVVPIILVAAIAATVLFVYMYKKNKGQKKNDKHGESGGAEMDYQKVESEKASDIIPAADSPSIVYNNAALSSTSELLLDAQAPSSSPIASEDGEAHPKVQKVMRSCQIFDVHVGNQLGAGVFGRVYQGEWNGAKVAVKTLVKESFEELLHEAKILKKLRHPNIIKFLGFYQSEAQENFIVTEFIEGGNLEQLLRCEPDLFTKNDLIKIACEIASGMRLLEQKGVVHRDLAARNILISITGKDFTAKVADFGMSRVTHEYYTAPKQSLFPIKWAAPEVIKQFKFSPKSDVWSMGVLLWEIFSNATIPYCTMSNKETAEWIVAGNRLSAPSDTPRKIAELMLKCWEADPQNRPTFVDIFNLLHAEFNGQIESDPPTDSEISLASPRSKKMARPSRSVSFRGGAAYAYMSNPQPEEIRYDTPAVLDSDYEDSSESHTNEKDLPKNNNKNNIDLESNYQTATSEYSNSKEKIDKQKPNSQKLGNLQKSRNLQKSNLRKLDNLQKSNSLAHTGYDTPAALNQDYDLLTSSSSSSSPLPPSSAADTMRSPATLRADADYDALTDSSNSKAQRSVALPSDLPSSAYASGALSGSEDESKNPISDEKASDVYTYAKFESEADDEEPSDTDGPYSTVDSPLSSAYDSVPSQPSLPLFSFPPTPLQSYSLPSSSIPPIRSLSTIPPVSASLANIPSLSSTASHTHFLAPSAPPPTSSSSELLQSLQNLQSLRHQ